MNKYGIDVLGSGAVLLGQDVVCDGFHKDRTVRVQTHIHDDHMGGFETSKGFQELVMSEATLELLIAEFNADLVIRENLYALRSGASYKKNGSTVILVPSGHMLGAVQVLVECPDGRRVGYSGDFRWPLDEEEVIQCEALVVDSTYGSPASVRKYSQEEAETAFVQLILSKLRLGSIRIQAHRGTIQRAIHLLGPTIDVPIVCSERLCKELAVYQKYGSVVASACSERTVEGKAAVRSGKYVHLYSKGDKVPVEPKERTAISLSAFTMRGDDPVLEYSDRAYRVALSNHADFEGTVNYVRQTGAKYVVTDNTRTHGVELAVELSRRLGIEAVPSTNEQHYEWGL